MPTSDAPTPPQKARFREHPLEFLLGLVGDVRPGEAGTALLLALNVFLLLTAYYLLKVAREPLILLGGGAEVKSYAAVGQSVLLILVSGIYGWLATHVSRLRLMSIVTVFFASNLVVFWALGRAGLQLGIPFFLWVGVFNLVIVAQFWSFAADIYSDEAGKRLFPLIGIGSSVGAVAGAWLAGVLAQGLPSRGIHGLTPYGLMLSAAAILMLTLGLTYLVNLREARRATPDDAAAHNAPIGQGNAFALVLKDRYLLLFAAMVIVLNIVTKTGDYVLDRMLLDQAPGAAHHAGITATAYIVQFKASYFAWGNAIGVALQFLVVSRVIKYLGLRVAIVLVPLASLAGYSTALIVPLIGVLFVGRVVESSLDYSLSTTSRQALWLVTSREKKYKAKQVIDTFIVRFGDSLSAAVVWFGTRARIGPRGFLGINVGLSLAWVAVAVLLGREYARRRAPKPADATP